MITVGRIAPVKDYETIIAACAILRDSWEHPWTLSVVGGPLTPGDHGYAARLKALMREKRLEEHIRFEGERAYSEIPSTLAGCDIFLNASRTGSLDKAVLEAMACGLTVITTNEGYRAILPPAYFLEDATAESFAKRIIALASDKRPNERLREIVVRDHALGATMDRMTEYLGNHV